MNKKIVAIIVAVCLVLGTVTLAACSAKKSSQQNEVTPTAQSTKKLSIVTTIFPEYDWVKVILGDNSENADITMCTFVNDVRPSK